MYIGIFLGSYEDIGGSIVFGLNMVKALIKKHNVEIICTKKNLEKLRIFRDWAPDGGVVTVGLPGCTITGAAETYAELWIEKYVSKISEKYDFFISNGKPCVRPRSKKSMLYLHFPNNIINFPRSIPILSHMIYTPYALLKYNHIKKYNIVAVNSKYSKKWTKKRYGVEPKLLYPPVSVQQIRSKKKNIVISIGRIVPDKKYLSLISAFKKLYKNGYKDWEYWIVGGEGGPFNRVIYKTLMKLSSRNYPIKIHQDVYERALWEMCSKAKILWHGKGFGVNENKKPEKAEHFGLSIVEAMSYGCVPVVPNIGGPSEIVTNSSGFCCKNISEFIECTKQLIENKKILKRMSNNAKKQAKKFQFRFFAKKLNNLIES